MKKLFYATLTLVSITSSLASTDCTYKIDSPWMNKHFREELVEYLRDQKGYHLEPSSLNVLNIENKSQRTALPVVNFKAIPDTVFLGMREMKSNFELSIINPDQFKIDSSVSSYRYFGDKNQVALSLHPKALSRGLKRAIRRLNGCNID